MKRQFAITGLLVCVGFLANNSPGDAACRQMLAPNGWQYITVCDGYRGGSNYSGAIAAGLAGAAIAADVLPGLLENLGDVTSGVGDITSNVVPNMSDPLQNFLSSTNQHGSNNDGALNPFNIFRQQPEAAAPKQKNAKQDEAPSLFPNIFAPQAPTVNTPHVNTPAPQANAPTVNTPLIPNIFAPQTPTVNTPQVNTPQVNTQAPSTNTPQVNTLIPNIFSPQVNTPTPKVNTPQVRTNTPQVYDPMVR